MMVDRGHGIPPMQSLPQTPADTIHSRPPYFLGDAVTYQGRSLLHPFGQLDQMSIMSPSLWTRQSQQDVTSICHRSVPPMATLADHRNMREPKLRSSFEQTKPGSKRLCWLRAWQRSVDPFNLLDLLSSQTEKKPMVAADLHRNYPLPYRSLRRGARHAQPIAQTRNITTKRDDDKKRDTENDTGWVSHISDSVGIQAKRSHVISSVGSNVSAATTETLSSSDNKDSGNAIGASSGHAGLRSKAKLPNLLRKVPEKPVLSKRKLSNGLVITSTKMQPQSSAVRSVSVAETKGLESKEDAHVEVDTPQYDTHRYWRPWN